MPNISNPLEKFLFIIGVSGSFAKIGLNEAQAFSIGLKSGDCAGQNIITNPLPFKYASLQWPCAAHYYLPEDRSSKCHRMCYARKERHIHLTLLCTFCYLNGPRDVLVPFYHDNKSLPTNPLKLVPTWKSVWYISIHNAHYSCEHNLGDVWKVARKKSNRRWIERVSSA